MIDITNLCPQELPRLVSAQKATSYLTGRDLFGRCGREGSPPKWGAQSSCRAGYLILKIAILVSIYAALLGLGFAMLRDSTGPFWPAIFFLVLATPVGIFAAYLATLKRIHWLTLWSGQSLVVRWLSGAWLRLILSILLAIGAAIVLLVRFSVASWPDLVLVGVCILLLCAVYLAIGRWLLGQYQPVYRHGRSLLLMAMLVAGLMSLIDPLVRFLIGAYGTYATPAEAIEAVRAPVSWLGQSSVSRLATEWGAFWLGWERFVLGRLLENPSWISWLALFVSGLLRFPLYLAVCFGLSAFFLPPGETKRIILPSTSDEEVPALLPKRIALLSATVTVSVLFIYLPLFGVLESHLSNEARVAEPTAVISQVERIGDQYFSVGSIDEVSRLSSSKLESYKDLMVPIEDSLALGFSFMRTNVDVYLDWYYSLPAEWGRVASLLAGNIDSYLQTKLTETLESGEPFKVFEQHLSEAISLEADLLEDYRQNASELLDSRRVDVSPGEEVIVVASVDREALLAFPIHSGLTTVEQRLATAAATTGVSGVVAAFATRQIILRASSSGVIRSAGVALGRLAVIRAGSTGTGGVFGAVIGGTFGSVVPVLGTVAGAAIGGAIGGLAMGVGAEYLMVKLEEVLKREEHHEQLIAAIDAVEAELLEQLRGPLEK